MIRLAILKRDERGAAAVEFALAIPVLISFIWGIFQTGMLLQANAAMQHALGEGARYATLYVASTTDHRPSDTEIVAKINSSMISPPAGSFDVDDPITGAGFKTLSVTYTMPMDFLFFEGPTVTMTRSKKVYVVV
ncbi:pilus assembly protein [Sphingomonas sabuli]|uniref:Pilus assembly protein n=1 Tax=Sphingomonas sabuli TaxID=2764186 RepID=A0A7G9L4T0_9SPHN|nr:TadE family protein [Sphingomonas sabuli]QNM83629.1 pilus assembly protein [Sphingomonas sabuli]